jgi:hypothetical protein
MALTWFQDTGWDYQYGPDIAHDGSMPERQITCRYCFRVVYWMRCIV